MHITSGQSFMLVCKVFVQLGWPPEAARHLMRCRTPFHLGKLNRKAKHSGPRTPDGADFLLFWSLFLHGMRNEFTFSSKLAWGHASTDSCFQETEGFLIPCEKKAKALDERAKGPQPHCFKRDLIRE
jgi:hypothetical protein